MQVFTVLPTGAKLTWLWAVLAGGTLVFVLGIGVAVYATVTCRDARLEVGNGRLSIKAGFYSRTVPVWDLDLDAARVVDLTREQELALRKKRNAVNLPGFKGGWWRTADGRKALAFVSDPTRVALVPTRLDYLLLVSLADPEAFLDALRRAG